jgi:hypothetical protein
VLRKRERPTQLVELRSKLAPKALLPRPKVRKKRRVARSNLVDATRNQTAAALVDLLKRGPAQMRNSLRRTR